MTEGERITSEAVAAFNAADADRFAALAHDDFLFVPLLTRSPDGEPYRGPEGARRYIKDANAWARATLQVRGVADHGDVVVSHCDLSIAVGDRQQVLPVVYVSRLRDGLVAEMATLADVSSATAALGIEAPPPPGSVLHLTLPAVPESIPPIRAAACEFARSRGFGDPHPVGLAVTEAATNAVLHAYLDAPEPGPIEVSGHDQPGGIVISVADAGRGLRPRADSPGLGMGLPLMQQVAAEVSFRGPPQRDAGTEVRLRFDRVAA